MTQAFHLCLWGAIRLTDPNGDDRTPKLAKSQALLAFLALAESRPVNRARLQDLLWSDRAMAQGRGSLRRALSDLRECFSGFQPSPLQTRGGPVTLDLSLIEVELTGPSGNSKDSLYQPEFLEGIDIYDEEFNYWLQSIRSRISQTQEVNLRQGSIRSSQGVGSVDISTKTIVRPLYEVGFEPVQTSQDNTGQAVGNLIIDRLSQLCVDSAIVRPFDLRSHEVLDEEDSIGPDVLSNLQYVELGGFAIITINFRQSDQGRLIYAQTFEIEKDKLDPPWIQRTAVEIFDRLCDKLVRHDGFDSETHGAAKRVFFAIDSLARLSNPNLSRASDILDEACDLTGAGTIYAWNAFVTAFRMETADEQTAKDLQERAESLCRIALERDPNNALSAALVGHVYSFVLKDHDRAGELLHRFVSQASWQPMLADTCAMRSYYSGKYDEAEGFARSAIGNGGFNPFRYGFSTAFAMAKLMQGDFKQSVHMGQLALAQQPHQDGHFYEPALRTLAAACGYLDLQEIGQIAYQKLFDQVGSSPRKKFASNDLLFPNNETQSVILEGLEKLNV